MRTASAQGGGRPRPSHRQAAQTNRTAHWRSGWRTARGHAVEPADTASAARDGSARASVRGLCVVGRGAGGRSEGALQSTPGALAF
eukprot:845793-Prymnesium_polylepis.3